VPVNTIAMPAASAATITYLAAIEIALPYGVAFLRCPRSGRRRRRGCHRPNLARKPRRVWMRSDGVVIPPDYSSPVRQRQPAWTSGRANLTVPLAAAAALQIRNNLGFRWQAPDHRLEFGIMLPLPYRRPQGRLLA
jgi:hypothetical protein